MTNQSEQIDELAKSIKRDLMKAFGPMIYGEVLYKSLGYTSADALRQAVSRNTVPIDIFPIEGRRGKFALTRDVAIWIATQKIINTQTTIKETLIEQSD